MALGQHLIPMGIDFDTSPLYIKSDKAYFMKGIESGWSMVGGEGQNAAELKPAESNTLYCSVNMPDGDNTVIGYYYYSEGNEGYIIVHNSKGFHFIYRLRGNDATCELVYNFCQNFKGISKNPKYFFSEGRIAMKSLCRYKTDGTKELYKELYLVNKQVDNLRIVVEDSIATNSFTTPFFDITHNCCEDRCRIIKSGVATPMAKIKIVPIYNVASDTLKQNTMLSKMFQFRFVDENAWGQRSEHGLISEQYFSNLGACSKDAAGLPRCVWLETKKPCPEIVRRYVEVRSCELKYGAAGTDGNLLSDWKEAFFIDFYDQANSSLKWYERTYDTTNKEFEFYNTGKNIRIKFCNNRECKPIPIADIRNSNPAPFNSGTVAGVGKGLAYGDNENNLGPWHKTDIDSIKLSLVKTVACEQKFSKIKVYAVVHNMAEKQNNPLHMRDGLVAFGGFGQKPGLAGNTRFEEKVGKPETNLVTQGGYGQYFPEGISGFRAILAGTNFKAESVQHHYKLTSLEKIGVLTGDLDSLRKFVKEVGWGRHWAIQEFDFGVVPLGVYRFRINGHNDTVDLEKTSTYYLHTTTFAQYNQRWGMPQNYQKEILIDTTNGNDFISFGPEAPLAVIADLTLPYNASIYRAMAKTVRGYIYEGRDNKQPIELAEVKINKQNIGGYSSGYTDHNGFYFRTVYESGSDSKKTYKAQLFGSHKCAFGTMIGETGEKKEAGATLAEPIYVADKIKEYDKTPSNRFKIIGKVQQCDTGGGIEGIAVVMARTAPVYTNNRGEFTVVAHYSNKRANDTIIFSVGGKCLVLDCDCKPIKVKITIAQPFCNESKEVVIETGTYDLKTVVGQGFPHGGRIQVGFVGHDYMGRMTDIQTSEKMFVDFPTEQEQGNNTYPQLVVTYPDSFSSDLCSRFKTITPWFSKNTNFDDFLEWAADDIHFIDSAGNKNDFAPTKIKIWYRSLNGYNILRGMSTNTTWNFYDTAGNSRLGDIVEFIQNADGIYLPASMERAVQYDQQGVYFLVDYDDSLRVLKAGVKFKIKRPYFCETKKTFYEFGYPVNLCAGDCIPRDDEGSVVKTFILNGFSSYMLPRQIPVVTEVVTAITTTAGEGPSAFKNIIVSPLVNKLLGWNKDTRYSITEPRTTEVKTVKTYPFSFEHHSPSDTWGDHCHNGGRVSMVNPYEGKKCDRNQILRTGSLNEANDGAVNYLHWFSLTEEYTIEDQQIQAMLVRDDGYIMLICEFTVFTFRTKDDRAVVDDKGFIRLPISSVFGPAESNPSFNYGCQSGDLNTIRKNDGLVTFLDSHKQAVVLHNFSTPVELSVGIESWLVPSIKKVNASKGVMYWHSCFDFRLKKLFLTKFDAGAGQYVNNEIDQAIEKSETIAYDFVTKMWTMAHFTPEYFGNMYGDPKDTQFFSFKGAQPYSHHNAVNPGTIYLNYFGQQCIPVIGVVTNAGSTVEKGFLGNEVYCRELLFIIERLESSLAQKSQVYEGAWERGAGISYAPYLCDTENPDACNTVQDTMMDGDTMYGRWLKALYIPNQPYNGEFFLLTAIVSYFFDRANNKGNK